MDLEALRTRFTQTLQSGKDSPELRKTLTPIVYAQLKSIAQRRMSDERRGHTLQATALVHEALIRLNGDRNVSPNQEQHFYAAAAEAMRRVLIDHARKKGSKKREGQRVAMLPEVLELDSDCDADAILSLDQALTQLGDEDPRAAEVVKLRFYAGLEVADVAQALNVSQRTVAREWSFARTRLFQLLGASQTNER